MAQDLGKTLLAEVEEVGFDEILRGLRLRHNVTSKFFEFPALDRILQIVAAAHAPPTKYATTPPVVEITSPTSGGGKTHLLYLLTALAILPLRHGGRQACVAIFDIDGTFSVARLVQQKQYLLSTRDPDLDDAGEGDIIVSSLEHVHVFRPQSLRCTIATLAALPKYLLSSEHGSRNRNLAFIALDSVSAFYWQARADEENAAFERQTGSSSSDYGQQQYQATNTQIAAALKTASLRLNSPVILTSWNMHSSHLTQQPQHPGRSLRSLRPSFPTPLSTISNIRLIVQRLPIRRFPASLSVMEALREAGNRQKAVEEEKFECVVNEWGLDPRTLERVHGENLGFGFKIGSEGVEVEGEGWDGNRDGR